LICAQEPVFPDQQFLYLYTPGQAAAQYFALKFEIERAGHGYVEAVVALADGEDCLAACIRLSFYFV
jgi:hypothetical protein